jgi:hypothetical protein
MRKGILIREESDRRAIGTISQHLPQPYCHVINPTPTKTQVTSKLVHRLSLASMAFSGSVRCLHLVRLALIYLTASVRQPRPPCSASQSLQVLSLAAPNPLAQEPLPLANPNHSNSQLRPSHRLDNMQVGRSSSSNPLLHSLDNLLLSNSSSPPLRSLANLQVERSSSSPLLHSLANLQVERSSSSSSHFFILWTTCGCHSAAAAAAAARHFALWPTRERHSTAAMVRYSAPTCDEHGWVVVIWSTETAIVSNFCISFVTQ